jgi:outer membrane protein insertion porin family
MTFRHRLLLIPGMLFFLFLGIPLAQELSNQRELIEEIQIRGTRRVPAETVKHYMNSQKNARFDADVLHRDFKTVWATGFFEDLKIELEEGRNGTIVIVWVREKPFVRDIKYEGLKSLTVSEVLDKYKEKKIGLAIESPYDPTKVKRASMLLEAMLAEKGRQYAVVKPEVDEAAPNGRIIRFVINEGPKVKVDKIRFEGNTVFSDRQLIGSMKYLQESGFISTFTGKSTYDRQRLDASLELGVRAKYNEKGYVRLNIGEPRVDIRDVTGISLFSPHMRWWKVLPVPYGTWSGKRVNIDVKLDEGSQYRVGPVYFTGNKVFTRDQLLRVFGMREGEVFNGELIKKGFDNLKKIYGALGYINWTPIPRQDFEDEDKTVALTFDFDEGRQYWLRTLEFSGNTSTRDKVLRREVLLNEGQLYNSNLLDISLLRLNQLGYFDKIKTEDATVQPDAKTPEVDVNIKVKERGKNSIGFNGGVSGYGGSFLGINYATTNFLGNGETLDLQLMGGTRSSNYVLSFTEPYFQEIPLSVGFSVFHRRYSNRQGDLYGGINGYMSMGNELFAQQSTGFGLSASYPIRPFTRMGVSYSLDRSNTSFASTQTAEFFNHFQYSDMFTGYSSYSGILRSKITTSLIYNTVDNPMSPSRGKGLTAAIDMVGGPLGGSLMYYRPVFEGRYFRPVNNRRNVLAARLMVTHVSGYGGLQTPIFDRSFIGGEDTIRGFDFYSVSPLALVTQGTTIKVPNRDPNGAPQTDPTDGSVNTRNSTTYASFITPVGGDTMAVVNLEYRIPIMGPVTVAPFLDIGGNWALSKSELEIANAASSSYYKYENGTFRHFQQGDAVDLVPGSDRIRSTAGLEIQVVLPVVNAPFRIIMGYNISRYNATITRPEGGTDFYYREKSHEFKFTVGRTF